ncbi:MAG: hypothetical protein ACLU9S_23550 [Oscillospiraceae bacterium]
MDFRSPGLRRRNSRTQIDTRQDQLSPRLATTTAECLHGSDHGFTSGVSAAITYGYSTFNSSTGISAPPAENDAGQAYPRCRGCPEWSLGALNIQWVCFNLSSRDLLAHQRAPALGNAKIYLPGKPILRAELSVLCHREDYRTARAP